LWKEKKKQKTKEFGLFFYYFLFSASGNGAAAFWVKSNPTAATDGNPGVEARTVLCVVTIRPSIVHNW
jgi:hypothetical protein